MHQQLLFDIQETPSGLIFQPDIIFPAEESELLALVPALPFAQFQMHGVTAKRRVVHFGLRYSFGSRGVSPAPPLPGAFEPLMSRAARLAGVQPSEFTETLITEYQPGAGIGWHHDAPPFGIIAGISLGAPCRMRFQKGSAAERRTSTLELPPRSIYLLTGSARSEWQHSIPSIPALRYSITFRTLR